MKNFKIKRATKEDLETIQKIARQTIDKCYRSFLGNEGVDWFINSGESDKEFVRNLENCSVLVEDDRILAFSIFFQDLIHLMMVDVSIQRKGIGTRLLAYSEDQLISKGNTIIRLETFDGNQQAINFYLKNNWVITKKEKDKEHDFVRVFFEKRINKNT